MPLFTMLYGFSCRCLFSFCISSRTTTNWRNVTKYDHLAHEHCAYTRRWEPHAARAMNMINTHCAIARSVCKPVRSIRIMLRHATSLANRTWSNATAHYYYAWTKTGFLTTVGIHMEWVNPPLLRPVDQFDCSETVDMCLIEPKAI